MVIMLDTARPPSGAARIRLNLKAMDTPQEVDVPEGADQSQRQLAELIIATARGDEEAFGELYRLSSRRVYGLARRILVDAELAEDTTQEVYLQVWQNAARFDHASGSAMAWLMTITHRRAVDKVRSSQSATNREARYGAATQSMEHDEVAETVSDKLDAEAVLKCLGTLTDTQQESVRMAYYGGLTYREVAEKLGAAVPTVKSRIRDGLLRLKSCLEVR